MSLAPAGRPLTPAAAPSPAPPGFPAPVTLGEEIVAWARSPDVAARLARRLRPAGLTRLVGFKRKRMFLFDPARVVSFELRSGLVHATFEDGESYTTNYSIRELAARLAPVGFFRAHRDVIVNLKRVKEIEKMGQGRVRLVLDTPDAPGFGASRPASARLRRLLRL